MVAEEEDEVIQVAHKRKRISCDCPHRSCDRRGENNFRDNGVRQKHLGQKSFVGGHPVCLPGAGCTVALCRASKEEPAGDGVEEAVPSAIDGILGHNYSTTGGGTDEGPAGSGGGGTTSTTLEHLVRHMAITMQWLLIYLRLFHCLSLAGRGG